MPSRLNNIPGIIRNAFFMVEELASGIIYFVLQSAFIVFTVGATYKFIRYLTGI